MLIYSESVAQQCLLRVNICLVCLSSSLPHLFRPWAGKGVGYLKTPHQPHPLLSTLLIFLPFPVRILLSLFLRGIQTPPKFVSFLRDYSSKGASLVAQMLKNLPAMQKTQFLFSPREEHGNPPQYSCLENPMDRGTWQATVHGVAKSRTRLK